jgi:energy-coupling factor transporter ATP-binding protein EcfA2
MTHSSPVIRKSAIPSIHGGAVINPFPGLRPFGPEEADLFFGREQHIEELLQRLTSSRFVAVVGTSGSGKSSLVAAGILPRLDGGFRTPFGSFWRVARMRPGDDPIGNLAVALAHGTHAADDENEENASNRRGTDDSNTIRLALTETGLHRSRLGLVKAAGEIGLGKRENLLVVVDQFEEIFRYRALRQSAHRDTATAFVHLLLSAARQTDVPVYVLITMRSDFLGECVQFRGLAEAINQGQYLIPLLNRRQRQAAIEGPAGVAGATVSGTLLQQLLNDAGSMTDQLPVLQHALMRTFDIWLAHLDPARTIDLIDYEEAGGTETALARHADEACRELNDEEQRVARVMFQCLAEHSRDGRWMRRPCRLGEILAVAETDMHTLSRIIDTFTANARSFLLLQPDTGELTRDTLVDLSHESLMRLWEKLQVWGEEEVRAAEQLRMLADAALRYEQDKGGLWSDPELALALKWQEEKQPNQIWSNRYGVDYEKVRAFIRKSREVRDLKAAELERDRMARLEQAEALATAEHNRAEALRHKAAAELERHRAEEERNNAEQLRQHARQLKKWMALVGVLAFAALSVAGVAVTQKTAAEAARLHAEEERQRAEHEKAEADRARYEARRMEMAARVSEQKARKAEKQALDEKRTAEYLKQKADEQREEAERQKAMAEQQKRNAKFARWTALKAKKQTESAETRAVVNETRAVRALSQAKRAEAERLKMKAELLQKHREKALEDARDQIPEWK